MVLAVPIVVIIVVVVIVIIIVIIPVVAVIGGIRAGGVIIPVIVISGSIRAGGIIVVRELHRGRRVRGRRGALRRRLGGRALGSLLGNVVGRRLSHPDPDGAAVVLVQFFPDLLGLVGLPVRILAGHRYRHRPPVGQISHHDGPGHQLAGRVFPVHPLVRKPRDQGRAVRVQTLQVQHPSAPAERHLHIRVDLEAQGAIGGEVGPVIAEKAQAQADSQSSRGHCGPQPDRTPGGGQAQLHHILHRLAHLIVQVGRL